MPVPQSTNALSRRESIARSVIDLAADGGARSVTHSAIDQHLGLAKGSTSYYFRTRRDLITSGAELMRATSAHSFRTLHPSSISRADAGSHRVDAETQDLRDSARPSDSLLVESATRTTSDYVHHLIVDRSAEVRARLALAPELPVGSLSELFFSAAAATELLRTLGSGDPARTGAGFLDLLEGILLRATAGPTATAPRTAATPAAGASFSVQDIEIAVRTYLTGAAELSR